MSLVTCPDCKNKVSSKAPACPHCGRPMGKAAAPKTRGRFTKIVSTLMTLSGLVLAFIGFENENDTHGMIGTGMFLVGLLWFIAGRIFS